MAFLALEESDAWIGLKFRQGQGPFRVKMFSYPTGDASRKFGKESSPKKYRGPVWRAGGLNVLTLKSINSQTSAMTSFGCVTARCGSSQRPTLHPCSP